MADQKTSIVITADDQTRAALESAKKRLGDFGGMSDTVAGKINAGMSNSIRNASYQVSDFIVQVQGGQGVMRSLSQQLPQLLAGFGTMGAVAGVVAGVMPTVIQAFMGTSDEAKKLDTAVGDLSSAIGEVGKASRDFTMDNLYKEFNKANAVAREGIIEQIKFQQALLDTQNLLANKSLSKSLEGLGDYTFLDKMKGAFADTGAEKLSKELGISVGLAQDILPSIKGLRNGTEDAGLFMAKFGTELAKSASGDAQKLLKDIKAVADGGKDAAAAASRLSEALQKMGKAGATGQIALPEKAGKAAKAAKPFDPEGDFFAAVDEAIYKQQKQSALDSEKAMKAEADTLDKLKDKYLQVADPLKQYYDQLAEINTLRQAAPELADQWAAAEDAVNKKMQETIDKAKGVNDFGKQMGLTFTSAFEDAIVGGKKFSEVLTGIGNDIVRILMRKNVTEPFVKAISDANWSSLFSFNADGGVYSGSGISAYSGQVVSRPTVFPFASGIGLMGEAGPEAILPLTRRNGKLGVEGGGSNVQVNVINNAGGTRATARERNDGGTRIIDVMIEQVESAIAGNVASGRGALAGALSSSYGLNRAAGAY